MAFLSGLKAQLKGRRDFVEATSSISEGIGEGIQTSSGRFFSFADFKEKSATGFVGLRNKGATCYLNSLLQALFMTPEFRRVVYTWQFDGVDEESCLARQLQRLFVWMQCSDRAAVDTAKLCKSFGWDSSEMFQQQDVQEMMTAMLSFLESSGEHFAGYLRSRHAGVLCDYLEFVNTPHKRERFDPFRDVQLGIKGCSSVVQALTAFMNPELMEGREQVTCDELGCKMDALKGMRFDALPYILTLQLKRFDLDFNTMQYVKLNDDIAIPAKIAAAEFLTGDLSAKLSNPAEAVKIYELYAVLVHAGSRIGGHYYAYIKNLDTGDWLSFNDETARALDAETLCHVLSEGPVTTGDSAAALPAKPNPDDKSKLVRSSTNAYMLMYRQVDADSNEKLPIMAEVPADLLAEVEADNAAYKLLKTDFEVERDTYSLRVFRFENRTAAPVIVKVNCRASMVTVLTAVHAVCGLGDVPLEHIRLRLFDTLKGLAMAPLSAAEGATLASENIQRNQALVLETVSAATEFQPWHDGDMAIAILVLQPEVDSYAGPQQIVVNGAASVRALRELVAPLVKATSPQQCRMVVLNKSAALVLTDDTQLLQRDLGMCSGAEIRAEWCADCTAANESSAILRLHEDALASITLRFNTPGTSSSDHSVKADVRQPLAALKDLLAASGALQAAGLSDVAQFRLKGTQSAAEWKDTSRTLSELGLRDGNSVFIEAGAPLLPGQFRLQIHLADDRLQTPDSGNACNWSRVGPVVVSGSDSLAAVKQNISESLGSAAVTVTGGEPITLPSPSCMRLRECTPLKLTTLYLDTRTLAENAGKALADDLSVVVQHVPEGEKLDQDSLLVGVQLWDPTSRKLGSRMEVVVSKTAPVSQLRTLLLATFFRESGDMDAASVAFAKPFTWQLSDVSNIPGLNWVFFEAEKEARPLSTWRLSNGDTLVAKDARVEGPPPPVNSAESEGAGSSGRSVELGIKLYTPQEQQVRFLAREQQQQEQALAVLQDRQDAIDRTAAGHSHGAFPPPPPPPPPPPAAPANN